MSPDRFAWWESVTAACHQGGAASGDSNDVACFSAGAEWALAGTAVCEFLADLARIYNAKCDGAGKRVTP